ncbi:tyrosine-protein kinase JAK1 isoform X1, partial [Tachysurus ichikawai]
MLSHDSVSVPSSRYKNYIPVSLKQSISQRNLLTRLRISNVFKSFLESFNDNMVLNNSINIQDLKVKYISTLETLTSHFGCEVYQPLSFSIYENDQVLSGYVGGDGARRRILVSGTGGIKWQIVSPE